MTICFCLLHYRNAGVTKRCVDSILDTTEIDDYKIIVVDNASNNGSYEELTEYYKNEDKIDLLHNKENIGFSRGNNVGYIYAKEKYNPRFILIGNNDLVFKQRNFVSKLIEYDNLYQFDVAGPDILDGDGNHQNPFRQEACSLKRIKELNRNKEIMLFLLQIKKKL